MDYRTPNQIANYNQINQRPIILIVLESPHVHEFVSPIGILKNTITYKRFESNLITKLLSSYIYGLINGKDYNVILANAVQYQCSLGQSLKPNSSKEDRDNNWIDCFNTLSKDLLERIDLIKPEIVINLCTKGLVNLQLILDNVLRPYCAQKNIIYTYGTHPFTWSFNYSRIF